MPTPVAAATVGIYAPAMDQNTTGCPAIKVAMMPRDTNVHGTIFGGVILSWIDQAGAVAARVYSPARVATVALKEVEFHEPVFVGDVVSFFATVQHLGRTSITVQIDVEAERIRNPGSCVSVTTAVVVYVATDTEGRKIPLINRPPSG